MRKIAGLLLAILLISTLLLPASAATEASSVTGFATVNSDGSCQVSLTVSLHLDEPMQELHFPVPMDAMAVSINSVRVSTSTKEGVRRVNLARYVRNVVGDVAVQLQYTIRDAIVTTEEGTLQLQVPLLSGFAYPVQKMEFSVTLPGAVEQLPGFFSGYHQNRIEEDLSYQVSGAVISGSTTRKLKDHETLTMTLTVDEKMFPRGITKSADFHWATVAMLICGGLALLYWIVSMFNRPGFARRQSSQPQGYHAGNLGTALCGLGFDLSMAVLEWALLGYILIYVKGNKVWLYKQMDMGNERSAAEVRWFKKLFARKNRVDTTEYRYAKLCRMAAEKPDRYAERMKRWNGSPNIFRLLAAGAGAFAGAGIAVALADGAALQGFWMVLLGICGCISGWKMQEFGYGIMLRDRRRLTLTLTLSGLWLVLSLIAGTVDTGILFVAMALVLSLLLAWGGRRTALGRLVQMQTVGFAQYLTSAQPKDLQRICRSDPEYFFRLAPGALALGREKAFAKRFGDMRLEGCPYLTTGMDGHMTALQWSVLMRQTVDKMNGRANRLTWERFLRLLSQIKRA